MPNWCASLEEFVSEDTDRTGIWWQRRDIAGTTVELAIYLSRAPSHGSTHFNIQLTPQS